MSARKAAAAAITPFKRWNHNVNDYCKLGLYHDDLLDHLRPGVLEAMKRLPQNVIDQRTHRVYRASNLYLLKIELPKEEWITLEEDLEKGRYLQPYIDEVKREIQEQKEWDSK